MLGRLSDKLVNVQTGIVDFLEKTTGEAELKALGEPTADATRSLVAVESASSITLTRKEGVAVVHCDTTDTGNTRAEYLADEVPRVDAQFPDHQHSLAPSLADSVEFAREVPRPAGSEEERGTDPEVPETTNTLKAGTPELDYRRLYEDLQANHAAEAEEWATLRDVLNEQIRQALDREAEALAECDVLKQRLRAGEGGGRKGDPDTQIRDLEQRLQVALTMEADLRMEVTARTELLESLKAEFHRTQQKEEKQLAIIRKDRDELRKKVRQLEKDGSQAAGEVAHEEAQRLKEEGEKLAHEVGLKNERIRELGRIRKELESRLSDRDAIEQKLHECERQLEDFRKQHDELQGRLAAERREGAQRDRALQAAHRRVSDLEATLANAGHTADSRHAAEAKAWEEREAQLVRDLQAAQGALEDISREADGRITSLMQELADLNLRSSEAEWKRLELSDTVPAAIEPLQQRIALLEGRLAPYLAGESEKAQQVAQLQAALDKVNGKARALEEELTDRKSVV